MDNRKAISRAARQMCDEFTVIHARLNQPDLILADLADLAHLCIAVDRALLQQLLNHRVLILLLICHRFFDVAQ